MKAAEEARVPSQRAGDRQAAPQLLQPILSGQEQVCTLAVWRPTDGTICPCGTLPVFRATGQRTTCWWLQQQKSAPSRVRVSVAVLPATALGPFLPPLASGPPGVPGPQAASPDPGLRPHVASSPVSASALRLSPGHATTSMGGSCGQEGIRLLGGTELHMLGVNVVLILNPEGHLG
ncbi:hypothetical protein CapIbe_017869 [Capra ibex]